MTLRDVTPRRLLKVLEFVGREGKRDDEAFAGLGCRGDIDTHLGAQTRHQVEADARRRICRHVFLLDQPVSIL